MAVTVVMRVSALFVASRLMYSAAATNEVGKEFLRENEEREGVFTLESGLQYKVLRKGSGVFRVALESTCECHYAGTTPSLTPDAQDKPEEDWDAFDSSYHRGETVSFTPSNVIAGWTEALQLMVEGDKFELYIPSELAYGDSPPNDKVEAGDVLIFRMELLSIKGKKKRVGVCNFKSRKNCGPNEIEMLDTLAKSPLEELEEEAKKLRIMKEDESLDQDDREATKSDLLFLMKLMAKRRQGLEL
mmetsp:Transcript_87064/g.244175  ORF Transcript_87064/g.244175 Transcript_87064/m.244175 type:complete len:245 (+) Transcript_87064:63-797(+)